MFGLGTTELVLILAIVVIIFGASKLPALGSGMGRAIKNFKSATSDAEKEVSSLKDDLSSSLKEDRKT
ncbi:MAG TPA: twin-arginine translocase TatA/TatE family subunit [Thermodesulfobacteriota bacterium]|nr:twin-arginine translocase TatA/TatE family subunit [Thermodesulfobacteriota bacterium]